MTSGRLLLLGIAAFVVGAVIAFGVTTVLPDRWNDELDLTLRILTVLVLAGVWATVLILDRRGRRP